MMIARDAIDPDAEKVVRRLRRYHHKAYLVGGCVRDLLLGRKPKDFDVATSATPNEIKDLFRNCRIIGRRFRLAHVFFGAKIIETSTFRSDPREGKSPDEVEELLIRRDNVFGTAEEDARRRDFTINGLFYDIEASEVIDYVGGLADLDARLVRTIGDPEIRFREDPVRILRAIKFAARLGFTIEPTTYAALLRHRSEIHACAPPRVLEEIYRLLRGGAARRSMELLIETGVAGTLAPEVAWLYGGPGALPPGTAEAPPPMALPFEPAELDERRARAWRTLDELDELVRRLPEEELPIDTPTNALLLAALVAPFVPEPVSPQGGDRPRDQFAVVEETLRPVALRLRVSRRDLERARQILLAQRRLAPARRRRARPMALVRRDWFAEALIVYELMARASGAVGEEVARWKQLARRHGAGERMADEGEEHAERADGRGGEPHERPAALLGPPAGDGEGRRRRRRRRGGRRRRRTALDGALVGGEALAAVGGAGPSDDAAARGGADDEEPPRE